MGARSISFKGMKEFEDTLTKASTRCIGVAKAALFDGAAVIASAYKDGLNSIKTEPYRYVKDGKRYASPEEKSAVLRGSYGIAKMHANTEKADTIVGVNPDSGYVKLMGKRVPVAVILRSIESGTSFMNAQHVLRRATNAAKKEAGAAMLATAIDRTEKLFK